MYDILKASAIWKIWQRGAPNFISGGVSDGIDPALLDCSFDLGIDYIFDLRLNWKVVLLINTIAHSLIVQPSNITDLILFQPVCF